MHHCHAKLFRFFSFIFLQEKQIKLNKHAWEEQKKTVVDLRWPSQRENSQQAGGAKFRAHDETHARKAEAKSKNQKDENICSGSNRHTNSIRKP